MGIRTARRLRGFDAVFLYQETPTAHMHTLKVAVIDPSTVPGGYSFALVREVLASRLHLLPPFTRRIVPIPLGLHHPVWVEDPDFDLDNHVFRTAVPAPGGPEELGALVSRVASRPLERDRPLWELYVVEGMEGGRIGCIAKVHHALADGMASAEMLMAVMGADGTAEPQAPPSRSTEPIPGAAELLADAALDLLALLVAAPAQLVRTGRGLRAARRRSRDQDVQVPRVFSGPRTPWNRSISSERIFAYTSMDLGLAKEVKRAAGTTLNDVVMAACAGAVRSYLARHGDVPDRPMVVSVPVSTRTAEEQGTYGNRVSNMFATLPVHLGDPVERLETIHAVNRAAKAQAESLGTDSFDALNEYSPPALTALWARALKLSGVADRFRTPVNLIISNVPGPPETLTVAGARLDEIYSVGPILEGIGLNITMWSYRDRMHFGLLSCRKLMPDLWDLAHLLHTGMDELARAVGVSPPAAAAGA